MRLLLITNLYDEDNHSAVEGVFNNALRQQVDIDIVKFSRTHSKPFERGHIVVLPYSTRKRGFEKAFCKLRSLSQYDIVIVRNLFEVLSQLQQVRGRTFKLGFWESFPHSFRRYFEAHFTGQSKLRKTLEYAWKKRTEQAQVSKCDFYLPITAAFKTQFRDSIQVPTHPLPMGINPQEIPDQAEHTARDFKRFTYIGTIDKLRQLDLILEAFRRVSEPYQLDIYTESKNKAVTQLQATHDDRIKFHGPLPRLQLFREIINTDVAIGLIPNNELYHSSSPTKVLEYYSLGIPSLLSDLPEHLDLFDESSAIFSEFNVASIQAAIEKSIKMPFESLRSMGARGKEVVLTKRSYPIMAESLLEFLTLQLSQE